MKRFTNGRGFWCLGGKAAKNYREKSVDVAGYDELAAFDDDIEPVSYTHLTLPTILLV
ncbi:hypothetical protein JMUB7528_28730 [Staphylococcus aureus]